MLNDTPQANRIHIAFFGPMNAGKSTLVNKFCGQEVAIVSDQPGTTTDPVSKAMEILPLGPCLITDTAGIDDVGELGAKRVERTLAVLATTDIAVWVDGRAVSMKPPDSSPESAFLAECSRRNIPNFIYHRGDDVEELKRKIAAVKLEAEPGLLEGLVKSGDHVVLVCPIDKSAPKGRLILPQVQMIREALDRHCLVSVCQVAELESVMREVGEDALVITDSQAFREVKQRVGNARLTSFSILFARQKGDLEEFQRGVEAAKNLKDGDTVLIAEACTHHRQCNDIGTTKIPKALTKLCGGKELNFIFASGKDFLNAVKGRQLALIVHCGGCMLTRRAMLARIGESQSAKVPIVNYGLLLQAVMAD